MKMNVVTEIDKLILKFIWKCREPRTARTILKENKRLIFLDFQTYHKAMLSRLFAAGIKRHIDCDG